MGVVGVISKEYRGAELEREIFDWWNKNNIYEKVKSLRLNKPKFYFLDGPPYVTNPIHVGTAWNKVLKDAFLRYFRMRGYNVRDQPGYDMHGLPIEVMVEKKLGLKTKKDIEKLGIRKFVEECKQYALEHLKVLEKQFKDLGVWMDWDSPYMTITRDYIEAEWWVVKKAEEKGLLAEGYMVFHWCPRCETVLSGYEVTEEYRVVRDPSIYVKFPVEGKDKEYILIWTTTPWTLPANVAVMVHPDYTYVKVRVNDEIYILAEARCEAVFSEVGVSYEIIERFPGRDLEGLKYVPPLLDEVEVQRKIRGVHRVVLSSEFVTMEEGTGCVHSAPGHGEEDFIVGLEYNLPVVSPVDEAGRFTSEAGKYAGKLIWDANEEIIEDLKRKNLLLHRGWIQHRYPHCWRCKTPLLLRATHQWFIKVPDIRDKLLEENDRVVWVPEWAGSNRFRNWLLNVRNWVISRQRYWGTPLPIWICKKCGRREVIGSIAELKRKALRAPEIFELHRPWIDEVVLKCECGGEMYRVPDTIDVWMDSSVASWACLGFPSNKEEFEKWWPADLILEGPDQTRGWFYTLLVSSFIGFNMAPYRRVLMHGWSLDQQGRAMHKSLGNVIYPEEVFSKYCRDAFRWYELQCTPWEDLRFSMKEVGEVFRVLKIMWNAYYFASLYMNLDKFNPTVHTLEEVKSYLQPEDLWLLSKSQMLIKQVTDAMDKLYVHEAARALRNFIVEDVSRWYIKLIRRRTWIEHEDPSKNAVYATLYYVLLTFLKLAAPIIPFIAEKLYQDMFRPADESLPESIHMCDWPVVLTEFVDENRIEHMSVVKSIVEASISARQSARIKLRHPLRELVVLSDDSRVKVAVEFFKNVLYEQANVKEVKVLPRDHEHEFMRIKITPNPAVLGPKLKDKMPLLSKLLETIDPREVKDALERDGVYRVTLNGESFDLTSEDLKIVEEVAEGYVKSSFGLGVVYLNVKLTEELVAEGLAREVVRRLQEMRKELDLPIEAYINAYVATPNQETLNMLKLMEWYILREVRVKELILTARSPPYKAAYEKLWRIDGEEYRMGITPI